jgi:hypothetical protein
VPTGTDTDDTGTEREFGARGTSKLRTKRLPRMQASGGAAAVECARVSRAFASILSVATASLLLHYAARLAAASATKNPGERAAAIAALEREREAALAALRASIRQQRKEAMDRARKTLTNHRFRLSFPTGRQPPFAQLREHGFPFRPLRHRRLPYLPRPGAN